MSLENNTDIEYMKEAIALADEAAARDEVPVGARNRVLGGNGRGFPRQNFDDTGAKTLYFLPKTAQRAYFFVCTKNFNKISTNKIQKTVDFIEILCIIYYMCKFAQKAQLL